MTVGYKEWSLVCEALGAGVQTVLLRKGGIAEGGDGFAFSHPRFHLFPTLFHQQEEQVRWSPLQEEVRGDDGSWLIRYEAEVVATAVLTDWEKVRALQPFHIWNESVVKERFEYQGRYLIHAALVRIRKREQIMRVAETSGMRGCRSWVDYSLEDDAFTEKSSPVLSDEEFEGRQNRVEGLWKN